MTTSIANPVSGERITFLKTGPGRCRSSPARSSACYGRRWPGRAGVPNQSDAEA